MGGRERGREGGGMGGVGGDWGISSGGDVFCFDAR